MARNVLTMDADRQPQCETLEPENPPAQQESNLSTRQGRLPDGQAEEKPKQIVSPFHLLLMKIPIELLFDTLHQLHIGFTVTGTPEGKFGARLYGNGILKYEVGSAKSPKAAIANVLAQFFCNEHRDIHEYK